MSILIFPIMLLNLLSGIVGGIWLAALGHWSVVFIGLALTIGGTFIVSILLMPSLLIVAPVMSNERLQESRVAMIPLMLFSVGYVYCVMGVWAIAIFWYFAKSVSSAAAIPVILWSYSIATAVWSYMGQKEAQTGNQYSALSAFFNQLGCISLMVYTYNNFRYPAVSEMIWWYGIPMAIALVINVLIAWQMTKPRY
jgi:hypothetical protein